MNNALNKPKTRGLVRRFLGNNRGNATIMVSLAAIPMLACAGIAIDYMRGVRTANELQQVADAAALAAASARNVTGTTSQQLSQRAAIATKYINASVANVADMELVGSPSVTTGPNTIDVTVNAKVKGSLANVLNLLPKGDAEVAAGGGGNQAGEFSSKDINLSVHSKVGFSEDAYLCLLAMNPTQTESIYFQGNSEFMATCSVHANSIATTAIRTWGSAEAYAASFCARGGWAGSGFEPQPEGGCSWVADPYVLMALPSAETCMTASNMLVAVPSGSSVTSAGGAFIKNTSYTLPPGTYCGGIEGKTDANITLQKGVYIIKDGDLKLDAQSELHADDGTVIYLTGSSSNIDITSGAVVQITGPNNDNSASGDSTYAYRGWAILHDRSSGIGNTNTIYSKGGIDIRGGLYQPSQKLVVWANGNMNDDSDYFPMIVNTLNMNGTSTLYVNLDWDEEELSEPIQLKQTGAVFVSQ